MLYKRQDQTVSPLSVPDHTHFTNDTTTTSRAFPTSHTPVTHKQKPKNSLFPRTHTPYPPVLWQLGLFMYTFSITFTKQISSCRCAMHLNKCNFLKYPSSRATTGTTSSFLPRAPFDTITTTRRFDTKITAEKSSSSSSSQRQPWDFGRFVKTVLYFNPPPNPLSAIQSLFTPTTTTPSPIPTTATAMQSNLFLIYAPGELSSSPAKEWGPVDDVVMGGVSSSNFVTKTTSAGQTVGVFTGNVTTANNGGFCSTRTRNLQPALDVSSYSGFELKIQGNGLRFKLVAKTDTSWDGIGYTASFDTTASGNDTDSWQTIRIPFSSLVPVFRAKTQLGAAPFDSSSLVSFQLMLSKFEYDGKLNPTFKEGPFSLPVAYIGVYRDV